jgi:hypothetical protein
MAVSHSNSVEHLDILREQKTNLSIQQQRHISSYSGNTEIDVEKGDDAKGDKVKGDEIKRDEVKRDEEKVDEEAPKVAKEQEAKDTNLIEWDGPNDPENPMNWPASRKWVITLSMGMMTFCGE